MLVVADTSALLALASCNNLLLLDALFREVRVPPAVFQECTVADKPEAERLKAYLRDKGYSAGALVLGRFLAVNSAEMPDL